MVVLVRFNLVNLLLISPIFVNAVPPDVCFSKFRWDDCGKPPTPVMYYWQPGSRCEVGIWRGCLPNPNMFTDEYECINTCIFVSRGGSMDALDMLKEEEEVLEEETTTVAENTTDTGENSTDVGDTTAAGDENTGGDGATGDGAGEEAAPADAEGDKPAEEAPAEK